MDKFIMRPAGNKKNADSGALFKLDLASVGAMILAIGGMQSFMHGPANNTAQFVFRISVLALGALLLGFDQIRKSKLEKRRQRVLYAGASTLSICIVAALGYFYAERHSVSPKTYAAAKIENDTYTNEALGIKVPLVHGWHATTNDWISEHADELGKKQLANGKKTGDVTNLNAQDVRTILTVSKFPLDPNSQALNPGLQMQLLKVPATITPERFIDENIAFMAQAGISVTRNGSATTRDIGPNRFYCLQFGMNAAVSVNCKMMVCLKDGIAIMVQSIYVENDDRAKLDSMMDAIEMK